MQNKTGLITLVFILSLLISVSSYGQFGQPKNTETKNEFKMQKRLYVGGGFDFAISSYATLIGVSPVIGYRLSPSFDIGTRLNYTFYSYNDDPWKFKTHNYGAAVFARYYLFFFNNLFLHAEYEALSWEYASEFFQNGDVITEREWISSLFVGGGYRQWLGTNAFLSITVLWNILDDINSPYSNPIFRIGVGVGI